MSGPKNRTNQPNYTTLHIDIAPRLLAMAWDKDKILEKPVVLVVEDEAIIRMETAQAVEDAGYAALDAPNTDKAMIILEGRRDIRAVFTEIRVPGHRNGIELGRTIAERWPLIRLLITSGTPKAEDFPANWHYIQKPYDGAQIAAALRALVIPYLTVVS